MHSDTTARSVTTVPVVRFGSLPQHGALKDIGSLTLPGALRTYGSRPRLTAIAPFFSSLVIAFATAFPGDDQRAEQADEDSGSECGCGLHGSLP